MSVDQGNASTPAAMEAMRQYYSTRPAPADPKAWFDENYPNEACEALVELEEAADGVMDLIQQHDEPLPRERILRIMTEEWARPGWQLPDGSGIYLDAENGQLLWTRGYDKATRPVTPESVLESTLFFGILAGFGSDDDIRRAALGPFREQPHLLLESSDARVRERAIAVLGETQRGSRTRPDNVGWGGRPPRHRVAGLPQNGINHTADPWSAPSAPRGRLGNLLTGPPLRSPNNTQFHCRWWTQAQVGHSEVALSLGEGVPSGVPDPRHP